MRDYYEDLLKAPKDAWSILGGLVAVFGVLAFIGYEPTASPLRLVVHGWRAIAKAVWYLAVAPLGIGIPDYAAHGLTVVAVLIGLGIRSWRSGHKFYGRQLALSYWPYSKEFEERDRYTILAVWLQLLFMLVLYSVVFRVNFWTPENIPRDAGHDAVRALVGITAVIIGCFPRAMGGLLLAALALVACDAVLPVIERLVAAGAGAT